MAHYIYANWKGYVDIHQVKQGGEQVLAALKHYQCTGLINDNRELFGSWTQAIKWLGDDYMPRLLDAGLQKIAFIYAKDPSARYSVDRFLEINDQYTGQTFEDFRTAEDWLLEKTGIELRPETSRQLTIRDHDHHWVIRLSDIYYLFSSGGVTNIHTRDRVYTSQMTLKDLMLKLPAVQFMQIHRSYLINVNEVITLKYYAGGAYHIFLKGLPKIKIPVSRQYAEELKIRLGIC